MDFATLPKIELHLHLDCSVSYEAVKEMEPSISHETYRSTFQAPAKCPDLATYIGHASSALRLMQSKDQLRLVTHDLFRQLKADNVIYAEIRFAPLLHTQQGLTSTEVIEVVNNAAQEGMAFTGIEAGIILCTLRHFSEAESMETVRLAEAYQGTPVVGFDIASDEAGYPIDNHVKAFDFAYQNGLNVTAHAGEAKGPESVWETLEHFRPSRIGHGVRSAEDRALLAYLKQKGIHLEVCPTSNVQTNTVSTLEQHPADLIYQSGISMSVNTDGRTLSNTHLTQEYALLAHTFGWEKAHFLKCNLEAVKHAFASKKRKEALKRKILEGFKA